MSCFTTSNPQYPGTPARMSDGRSFTDYRARCETYPVKASGTWGAHEARQRMIHESDNFREVMQGVLNNKMGATKCTDTMVPELYKRVCTWEGCKTIPGHYAGIGIGRIYNPNLTALANDPQGLANSQVPTIPLTAPVLGPERASQCAGGDPEMFWKALSPTQTAGSRAHPYSAPRA